MLFVGARDMELLLPLASEERHKAFSCTPPPPPTSAIVDGIRIYSGPALPRAGIIRLRLSTIEVLYHIWGKNVSESPPQSHRAPPF